MSQNEAKPSEAKAQSGKIRHKAYDTILEIVKAGEYPYLSGPTGSGKTTIGEQIAEDLGLEFAYTGAVDSYAQIKGFKDVNSNFTDTAFTRLYQNGGVFLFDEIDASDPQALLTVNAAIANRKLDLPNGKIVPMHPDFKLLAAGNTSGKGATLKYTARSMIDSASLDRYTEVHVDYDPQLETMVAKKIGGKDGMKMLTLVHQAREAFRSLQLDRTYDVSTRALAKGVHFMNAGMPIEKAFHYAVMDKLDNDTAQKLLAKIDFSLKEFKINVPKDSLESFRTKIAETLSVIEQFQDAKEEIMKLQTEAEEVLGKAFESVSGLSGAIIKVRSTVASLEGVAKMAEGLDATTPQIRQAVQEALDSIKGGP